MVRDRSKIRLISRFCPLVHAQHVLVRTYTRTSRLRFELLVRKGTTGGGGMKTRSSHRSIVMRIGLWSSLPYPRLHNLPRPVRSIYFCMNSSVAQRWYDYGSPRIDDPRGSSYWIIGRSGGCLGFLGMFGTLGLCSVLSCPFTGRPKIVDPFSLRNDIGFLASSLSLSLSLSFVGLLSTWFGLELYGSRPSMWKFEGIRRILRNAEWMVFLGRGFLRAQHVACVCRLFVSRSCLCRYSFLRGIFLLMFPFVIGIAVFAKRWKR